MKYDYSAIEKKWQRYWEENESYKVEIDHSKPKYYALVEFPYPSGQGLHVGHPRSYEIYQNLQTAIETAYQESVPGDIVLLSPASASFDQFKNFEERGDFFVSVVKGLL